MSSVPKSYHRDDLRGELIAAGHGFIALHGHEGLSVRAIAQRLGVSPGAPYHHFPDRRALLVALAGSGFDELNRSAEAIVSTDRPAAEKLAALGHAFLGFCTERPRLLELMYDSELTHPELEPLLAEAQHHGFQMVMQTVSELLDGCPPKHVRQQALAFWATLYGYGALTSKGMLPAAVVGTGSSRDLTKAVVDHAVALTRA